MKRFIILTTLLSLLNIATVQAAVLSDVKDHTYKQEIQELVDKGIINGYPDSTFKPDQEINRAEFLKIVLESQGNEDISGEDCFQDVKKEWFAKYVCYAQDKKIVQGYPDGTFQPERTISHVEALKVLYLVNSDSGKEVPADQAWYLPYTADATENKIDLDLQFEHLMTRGEIAGLVSNYMNKKVWKEESPTQQPDTNEEEVVTTEPSTSECLEDYTSKLVTETPYKKSTLLKDEVADFKKTVGISSFCLPSSLGQLFLNVDWDKNSTDQSFQADSGRMISIGFEKLFNPKSGGWGDAHIIYSTYDFAIGSEYNIYAQKEDYKEGKNEPIVKNEWSDFFGTIERSTTFVFENHYFTVVYRLQGDYASNHEQIIKDLEAGKYPAADESNLQAIDEFIKSISFE